MLKLFGKKGSVLGVDLGTSSVKVVQASTSGKKVVIERVGFAPVKLEGNRTDPSDQALTDALKVALAESGATSRDVCCSISGDSVIVRYLQFPDMPDDELGYALRLQAEEFIPFRLDEVNLDYYRLTPTTKDPGKKADLILVAARKDLVTRRVDILRSAGLNPVIMDTDSFAVLNCVESVHTFGGDEVLALVSMGATYTNINIFEGNISRFARDITAGGNTISQAISSRMQLSFSEAERIKCEEGFVSSQDVVQERPASTPGIAEVIKDTVEKITGEPMDGDSRKAKLNGIIRVPVQNLLTEIRRSLQFYENQPNGKPINKILLTGGGAMLKNLDQYMSERLGLPVTVISPIENAEIKNPSQADRIKTIAPRLTVAIGLALRQVGDK